MPIMVNLRQDPFERTPMTPWRIMNEGAGATATISLRANSGGSSWFKNGQKIRQTAMDYPPMQDPACFNLEAVKQKIEATLKNKEGQ